MVGFRLDREQMRRYTRAQRIGYRAQGLAVGFAAAAAVGLVVYLLG